MITCRMNEDEIKRCQRNTLNIEPDDPTPMPNVWFNPYVQGKTMCSHAEQYFQDTLTAYHQPQQLRAPPPSLGATAIIHNDTPIGLLKNHDEQTMLCVKTVRGEHDYLLRGYIYAVDHNTKKHAQQGFNTAHINCLEYGKGRAVKASNLRDHRAFNSTKTLLDKADEFIEEQRR
jgi:hypothetical protein